MDPTGYSSITVTDPHQISRIWYFLNLHGAGNLSFDAIWNFTSSVVGGSSSFYLTSVGGEPSYLYTGAIVVRGGGYSVDPITYYKAINDRNALLDWLSSKATGNYWDKAQGGGDRAYLSFMDGDIYQVATVGNSLINSATTEAWIKSVKYVKIGSAEAQMQKILSKLARGTKYAGWVGNTLSVGVSYTEAYVNRNGPNAGFYQAQAIGSTIIVGLNALNFVVPGLGTVLSITAGAVDASGGFNWIYKSFND